MDATVEAAQAATGSVTIELSYWVPTRFVVRLDAAAAAEKLRAAGYPSAAETADKIARGEITSGDASEHDEDEPAGDLAAALARNASLFGADQPAGEPDDWDDSPEDYHVWIGQPARLQDRT